LRRSGQKGMEMQQTHPITNLDQEFKDLDRGWVAAYLQGDAELFNRIWTEGFVFTFPFGQFCNKAQEISNIESGTLLFESISSGNPTIKVYGDTAVMTGNFALKGNCEGRNISGLYTYTNVLGRQADDLWKIVASQANQLA